MATVADKLTVAEFEKQYGYEKPYYEFWHGEAVQKSASTWIHGLLQGILADLLSEAGYTAGSEVKLKIDPDFHPVPDVIATRRRVEVPYPTRAVVFRWTDQRLEETNTLASLPVDRIWSALDQGLR